MPIKVVRETHETPEYVTERLIRAGGLNRFGEPNYRAVWGWNRLTLIGGEWEQDNLDGKPAAYAMRRVPKYPQLNRWHLEKWVAPEVYGSPWTWNGSVQERELGPYPYRGEYEHAFTLEGPHGEFIQLSALAVEYIAQAIEKSRAYKPKKRTLYAREAKKDKDYLTWAEAIMDDNATWAYTPHTYIPASIKEKIA